MIPWLLFELFRKEGFIYTNIEIKWFKYRITNDRNDYKIKETKLYVENCQLKKETKIFILWRHKFK